MTYYWINEKGYRDVKPYFTYERLYTFVHVCKYMWAGIGGNIY